MVGGGSILMSFNRTFTTRKVNTVTVALILDFHFIKKIRILEYILCCPVSDLFSCLL